MGDPLPLPDRRRSRTSARRARALLLADARRRSRPGIVVQRRLRRAPARSPRRAGGNLDNAVLSPLTGGASSINIYGAVEGQSVYRPNALTGDPNHLGIMLIVPLLVLLPVYLRLERGHRLRRPARGRARRSCSSSSWRRSRAAACSGSASACSCSRCPYRRRLLSRDAARAARRPRSALVGIVVLSRLHFFETVIRSRVQTGGSSTSAHFGVYDFIPHVLSRAPAVRARPQQLLRLLRVRHRQDELGPALVLRRAARRDRARRRRRSSPSSSGTSSAACTRRARSGARWRRRGDPAAARVRPLAWGLTAALAGTLAANFFYLTMTFYYFYVLAALVLAAPLVVRAAWTRSSLAARRQRARRTSRLERRRRCRSSCRQRQKARDRPRSRTAKWKEHRSSRPRAERRVEPTGPLFVDVGAHVGTTVIAAVVALRRSSRPAPLEAARPRTTGCCGRTCCCSRPSLDRIATSVNVAALGPNVAASRELDTRRGREPGRKHRAASSASHAAVRDGTVSRRRLTTAGRGRGRSSTCSIRRPALARRRGARAGGAGREQPTLLERGRPGRAGADSAAPRGVEPLAALLARHYTDVVDLRAPRRPTRTADRSRELRRAGEALRSAASRDVLVLRG